MKRQHKNRLLQISRFIKLKARRGHMEVQIEVRGQRPIAKLSNVHDRLTAFERNALLIHFYKVFERMKLESWSRAKVRGEIEGTNYAEVFGSPWSLDGSAD
jgi:hypothetical protein